MEIVTVFACDECGFDNTQLDNAALVALIASAEFPRPLPAARPAPDVWSPLEYANHYRDAIEWYGARIELVLTQDRPQLNGRDFTVAPVTSDAVFDEITAATDRVVARLRALSPEQWRRVGIGSSDGGERDIRNLASRLAHEAHHHLLDIDRGRAALGS